MNLTSAREGVFIAVEALRSNKVRSALTILGIVIGVATVMAMAAIITGVRSSITGELEALGPKNFIVERFDQTQLRVSHGGERPPWEGKPSITPQEAELIRQLPSVRSVAVAVGANADLRYGSREVLGVMALGRGVEWPNYSSGDFVEGRNFLPADEARATPVVVLSKQLKDAVFGDLPATGKAVRLGGERFLVVGVYQQTENIFEGLGGGQWAILPPSAALKHLDADRDWLSLLVVPAAEVTQDQAMDDVTATLRVARGLRPGEENNFALIRQEAFLDLFNRLTGTFFLVMLVLSAIGLLVGGVGVVAIMMISVTERTREIGVRKALGARRREILWQFLVEAMTVTMIGGLIGLALGAGGALLVAALTPVPAAVPLTTVVAAMLVFAAAGILFGVGPAVRAARLDPVEALRYE